MDVTSTRIEEIESAALDAARKAARRAIEETCERLEASRRPRHRVGTRRRVVLTKAGWITRVELANAVFEYLEIFHNRRRRHSALGMRTPIEFEKMHTYPSEVA